MGEAKRFRKMQIGSSDFSTCSSNVYQYVVLLPGAFEIEYSLAVTPIVAIGDETLIAEELFGPSVVRSDGIINGEHVVIFSVEGDTIPDQSLCIINQTATDAVKLHCKQHSNSQIPSGLSRVIMGPAIIRHVKSSTKVTMRHHLFDQIEEYLEDCGCLLEFSEIHPDRKEIDIYVEGRHNFYKVRKAFGDLKIYAKAA